MLSKRFLTVKETIFEGGSNDNHDALSVVFNKSNKSAHPRLQEQESRLNVPQPRVSVGTPHDIKKRTKDEILCKRCPTCFIIKTPRVFHCGTCNCCISVHDHHCPYLGTCIGQRNHKFFYTYLWLTELLAFFTAGINVRMIRNI